MKNLFRIEKVKITYGFNRFVAVENLSLNLTKGRSLALLGLNGAGKTSTLKLIMGMIRPKEGSVTVFGGSPGSVRALSQIGFAPEEATPPEYLSASEYLNFVGGFRHKDKKKAKEEVDKTIDFFELPRGKKVGEFSKGMRRKIVLARALLGDPPLLILDEPLNGLDPLFIIKLRERIEQYLKMGGTLLFSSHILSEVEKVCDEVAIIKQGKLVCLEDSKKIMEEFGDIEKGFAHYMK